MVKLRHLLSPKCKGHNLAMAFLPLQMGLKAECHSGDLGVLGAIVAFVVCRICGLIGEAS